ncbi:MAG: DUF6263 family protein [Planctomycetota bacterium]
MSRMLSQRAWGRGWRQAVVSGVSALAVSGLGAVGPVASAEAIEIKPNFKVGDAYAQRLQISQNIEQSFMGNDISIDMDMAFDLTTTVEAAPNDSVFTLTLKYDRVEAEVNGPMGPGAWRSGDPQPQNPMLLGFAAMDGAVIRYDYDIDGEVTNLEGTEAIVESALASVPEAMRPQLREVFESQFGEEQMATMIEAGHGVYPDAPVVIGESWEQSVVVGGVVPMKADTTYTLLAAEGVTATTAVTGTLETTEDATMPLGPGMEADMAMEGTQEGTVVFALDSGWVRSMNLEQDIEGELTMANPQNPGGPPITIPMQIETTIAVEMIE